MMPHSKLEIFDPVVIASPVLVMNRLVTFEGSTKMPGHDDTVFQLPALET